ncbi:hypothetical protein Nepgr_015417 [Nepenthes gracilis]|uniref:Tubulin alpha-6 chain n=1 Tax=Nepenthes gracilis TaxID=150966 RepID=A0AAD3XRA0_NEPGR|nr:hypothetical protein Nepgr_015417 [Nepenthes gracilis]
MASIHVMKSSLSPSLSLGFRELSWFRIGLNSEVCSKRVLRFPRAGIDIQKRLRVCCKFQEGDNQSNGEEPPESLFMKELRRRGINPTSLLEEGNRSTLNEEMKEQEGDRVLAKRNAISTDSDDSLTNQREQSMALNSEGLEGLVPRAKLLLTLGGTFFFGLWPLILMTVAFFSALYLYLGPNFIHDASKTSITPPPQYIDPYVLLQEKRISQ